MTMAASAIIGGGIAAAGSLGSAYMSSQAANSAANTAADAETNALMMQLSGENSALATLSPYYTSGLTNNALLSYLLNGTTPTATTETTTPYGIGTDSNWSSYSIDEQIAKLQQNINAQSTNTDPGEQSAVTGWKQDLAQLQASKTAAANASSSATSSGLGAGYLTNIPSFSYDVSTDTNLAASEKMANSQIAAQQAAGGGFGSGNMASSIATELAGTLEPTYYNQALQNYTTNQITPRELIYNMLSGQNGSSTANTIAGIDTGTSTSAANTASSIGQSLASGTSASSAATTNALTGVGNAATSGVNTYANYSNQSQLAALIKQLAGGTSGGYSSADDYIFGGTYSG